MQTAEVAAIVGNDCRTTAARLRGVLGFLGIPCRHFNSPSELAESARVGSLSTVRYSVIGPLQSVSDVLFHECREEEQAVDERVHSAFAYLPEDAALSAKLLRGLTGARNLTLAPLDVGRADVEVLATWPELTGPMHGIAVSATTAPTDRILRLEPATSIRTIVSAQGGAAFLALRDMRPQLFVSCSSTIVDVEQPMKEHHYDVKDGFLSAVPLLMYLKWAFRDACWQANEAGACLIIDDPTLRAQYGFCNFRELDMLMREHSFTTNIAFIPWNWRKTKPATAELIRKSAKRLSISIHGCDHTSAEFGTSAQEALNGKVASAKGRMERHKATTGVDHDLVMVFPQGVFSRESLRTLQQHQFIAAVNTELLPANREQEFPTIAETWSVALLRYWSFPLFPRRYPDHGLANFAFDLLLGKPCLIVEHHRFFKDGGRHVVDFVAALNSLNCELKWRALGDVIRRSYHWRRGVNGVVDIRMFSNELVLVNEGCETRRYRLEKSDQGSVGIESVVANGACIGWQREDDRVVVECELRPGAEIVLQIQYSRAPQVAASGYDIPGFARTAARRCLSELRDNMMFCEEGIVERARRLRGFVSGGRGSAELSGRPEGKP